MSGYELVAGAQTSHHPSPQVGLLNASRLVTDRQTVLNVPLISMIGRRSV